MSASARWLGRAAHARRAVIAVIAAFLTLGATTWPRAAAAPAGRPGVKIGVSLALTGPDARWGVPILRGVELAVEDVNRGGGAGGHPIETVVLDSAGPGFEGISRWRGTNNYERLIADPAVLAVVGPQTSGEARGVAALLSRADLATITPSATTFDITDPDLRDHFRPGGRAVFFRTVGTDLAQGRAMARFAHERLGVRRVVLIDDGTGFAQRTVQTFARHAGELGVTVLGRAQIAWSEGDYRPRLRDLRALDPDALYFAGNQTVGVKVARQVAEILPSVHRLGAETLYDRGFPIQAGPAADGWHVSNVAPDVSAGPAAQAWAERFQRRFGEAPSSYALTAYTAVAVVAKAAAQVAASGRPITRSRLRDAIQAGRLPDTPQGMVSFDANGDLERPVVSIYQVRSGAFQYAGGIVETGAPRPPGTGARP